MNQKKFDKLINEEVAKIKKQLPLDLKNQYSVNYWKGFVASMYHYAKECNMPNDIFKRKYLLIENEITTRTKDNPLRFYWSGYKRGYALSRTIYADFIKHEKENGTYVKSEYTPRKVTTSNQSDRSSCPF